MQYKNISFTFPALDKCSGDLFNKEEKEYFYPLITSWAGSDSKAATWLKNEKLLLLTGIHVLNFVEIIEWMLSFITYAILNMEGLHNAFHFNILYEESK